MCDSDTSDSDYVVEYHIKPDRIGVRSVNDESADILGNFDDAKRKDIEKNIYPEENIVDPDDDDENKTESEQDTEDEVMDKLNGSNDESFGEDGKNDNTQGKLISSKNNDGKFGEHEFNSLLRGRSKPDRLVLYVTNLNFATSKENLAQYFEMAAGPVKAVRIPKKRKGGFAFIEMSDLNGFKKALSLHNTTLDERPIKVQLSEAGKKKSANKKNILKQKNRKLAEMRNETKSFTKSGKNYDKNIKKEMEKEKLQKTKMWERRKARRNKNKNK